MHTNTPFSFDPEHFEQHPLLLEFFPKQYLDQLRLVRYKPGQLLYQQGEDLEQLSYFLHGKLKILRRLFNGKEHILGVSDQPLIIGSIELLTGKPVVATVSALEESWVVHLPLTHFKQQLLQDPDFLYKIGQTLALSLYQQNIQSATNLSYRLKERLASYILGLHADTVQLELGLLADSFGTSYRHLLRTIQHFRQEGFLHKEGRRYHITNRPALQKLAIPED